MSVSLKLFLATIELLEKCTTLSIDTETSGLYPYNGDALFSIIVGTEGKQFYFNFNRYLDFDQDFVLPRNYIVALSGAITAGPAKTIFMHNAKFDLAFLAKEGAFIHERHTVHDTEVVARLLNSNYESYSLDACASRIGFEKSDAVMEYLKKEKLFEFIETPGKKKREKKYFFDKVPPEIIIPYGLKDAEITYELGVHQLRQLTTEKDRTLYANETALTRVCFAMEQRGIRIDRNYCEKAKAHELEKAKNAAARFKDLTGVEFIDSNKVFSQVFTKEGVQAPRTAKGNPSFTDAALASFTNSPIATAIRDYRDAYKRANTYYANFINLADSQETLHANIRQSATFTGRFSMSEPNLQNITKEEEGEFQIRKVFIPREGYTFYEIDYKAMEFRLMLDYAGERELCKKILYEKDANGKPYDPHQATADLVKIERKKAKTLNFGLLYGMGAAKLSHALMVSLDEAKKFKRQYFDALPRVRHFIQQATNVASQRGYVHNWAGKKYFFPESEYAYKAANAIIQGGCSEIMKFAMVKIHDYLSDKQSKMLVQIHDAVLLEVWCTEHFVPYEVANIMRNAYQATHMPMDCSISKAESSWGSMKEM